MDTARIDLTDQAAKVKATGASVLITRNNRPHVELVPVGTTATARSWAKAEQFLQMLVGRLTTDVEIDTYVRDLLVEDLRYCGLTDFYELAVYGIEDEQQPQEAP